MNRPIKGKFVFDGGGEVEILGTLADAHTHQMQVGHAVVDDVLPIVRAVGAGGTIRLAMEPHPPQAIEVTVIELRNKIIRFRIHAEL